jgi:hypothetical protein
MVTVTAITTAGVADADIIMDGIAGTTTMGSESLMLASDHQVGFGSIP